MSIFAIKLINNFAVFSEQSLIFFEINIRLFLRLRENSFPEAPRILGFLPFPDFSQFYI